MFEPKVQGSGRRELPALPPTDADMKKKKMDAGNVLRGRCVHQVVWWYLPAWRTATRHCVNTGSDHSAFLMQPERLLATKQGINKQMITGLIMKWLSVLNHAALWTHLWQCCFCFTDWKIVLYFLISSHAHTHAHGIQERNQPLPFNNSSLSLTHTRIHVHSHPPTPN